MVLLLHLNGISLLSTLPCNPSLPSWSTTSSLSPDNPAIPHSSPARPAHWQSFFLPVLDAQESPIMIKAEYLLVVLSAQPDIYTLNVLGCFFLKSFPITGRVEDKTNLIHCRFLWVYTGGTQHFTWVQWGLAGGLGGVQCEMAAAVGGWSSRFSFAWYKINHLRNPGKTVTEFGSLFFSYHFACWRESTAKQPMSIPIALEFSKAASSPSGTASCCLLWDLMKPGLQVVWLFLEMQH